MKKRRRIIQTLPLRERVELWADNLRNQAALLPPGRQREALLQKVKAAQAASHLDAWANSVGLQAPK